MYSKIIYSKKGKREFCKNIFQYIEIEIFSPLFVRNQLLIFKEKNVIIWIQGTVSQRWYKNRNISTVCRTFKKSWVWKKLQISNNRDVTSSNIDVTSSNRYVASGNRDVASSNRDVASSNRDVTSSNRDVTRSSNRDVTRSSNRDVTSNNGDVTNSFTEM